MDKIPKLLKPYYTINEVFNRLNLVGAHLDKEADINLIASEGELELSLLLEKDMRLMSLSKAYPLCIKTSFCYKPTEIEVTFVKEKLGYTDHDITVAVACINLPIFLLPNWLIDEGNPIEKIEMYDDSNMPHEIRTQHSEQLSMQAFRDTDFVAGIVDSKCCAVTPYQIYGLNHDLEKYNLELGDYPSGDSVVLELNDEKYYVVEHIRSEYLSAGVMYRIIFKDGEIYWPQFRVKASITSYLQRRELFVVSKSNLQRYEREFLGVDHDTDTEEMPSYLDRASTYYAKELDIAIQAHTAIFINKEGNQNQSLGTRVESWLKKHYPDEKDMFYKRIKTVVLPKDKNKVT